MSVNGRKNALVALLIAFVISRQYSSVATLEFLQDLRGQCELKDGGAHSQLNKQDDVAKHDYIFLDSSHDQYATAKVTLKEFVFLAVLSSRRPVMPFLGTGKDAFVGLPDSPGSSGLPVDEFLKFHLPIRELTSFPTAFQSCQGRIRFATVAHPISGESCAQLMESVPSSFVETMELWGAQEWDCMESNSLDIQYFENSTDCIVLHRFRGLRNGKGNILWEHSKSAAKQFALWNLTERLMTTEYTHLQKSPILYPRPDFLLRAAQCNTDLWGNVFDVLQYRAEWVCIKLKQGVLGNQEQGMKTFAENCIHKTIDELLKLRQDDKETPIVLLHDLGKHGSHSPNAKTSCQSIFPVSRLAHMVQSRIPQVPVFGSTECNVFDDCHGPTCYFMDMAIFLQARHAVQLGNSPSSKEIRLPRIHGGRNTTSLQPTKYNDLSCPCNQLFF